MAECPIVLLVDDTEDILDLAGTIFSAHGCTVFKASSGKEGLLIAKKHEKIDIVVSDYNMPGINGESFLKSVKIYHPDSIRILISGHADINIINRMMDEDLICRFVQKPFEALRASKQIGVLLRHLVRADK